jgi:hypothetical protein
MCNSSNPIGAATTDRSIGLLYSESLFIWDRRANACLPLNAGNLNRLRFIKRSAAYIWCIAEGGYFSHLSLSLLIKGALLLVLLMKRQEAGAGAKSAPHTRSLFNRGGARWDFALGERATPPPDAALCERARVHPSYFQAEPTPTTNTHLNRCDAARRARCRRQAPFSSLLSPF